ncbi:12688_t:CDS:1, partial [Entrophospora sp. SA101]
SLNKRKHVKLYNDDNDLEKTRYLKTLCSSINNFPSTKTVINENEDAEINQQNGLNNSSTSYRRQVTLYVLMNLYRFHIILPSIVQ